MRNAECGVWSAEGARRALGMRGGRPSLRLSPRAAGREDTEPWVVRMVPGLAMRCEVLAYGHHHSRSGTGWRPNPTESKRIKVNQGAVFMRRRFHGLAQTGNEYADEPCRGKSSTTGFHPFPPISTSIHRYPPTLKKNIFNHEKHEPHEKANDFGKIKSD